LDVRVGWGNRPEMDIAAPTLCSFQTLLLIPK
jgi:hypothetical protein